MSFQAIVYTNNLSSPTHKGTYTRVSEVNIHWAIHGGVQTYDLIIYLNQAEAWDFFRNRCGFRLLVVDRFVDIPVADGFIYTVTLIPEGVRVGCRGFWERHFDEYYVNVVTDTDSTSEVLKDILTTNVPAISSDQDHIGETNTVIGFWEPPDEGMFPGDVIQMLAALSDTNDAQWNYWLLNGPLDGINPAKPVPYFKAQVNDGTFNWQIWRRDLTQGSLVLSRDISQLANDVQVLHTDPKGYLAVTAAGTDSDSDADYWTREAHITIGDCEDDVAPYYRDLYLDKYKQPLLQYEFTISAGSIMDNNQSKWPIWMPIKRGGGYMRMNDILPDSVLFDTSWDRLRVGQIMEMQYSSKDNSLNVSLDQESFAIDAVISRMDALR